MGTTRMRWSVVGLAAVAALGAACVPWEPPPTGPGVDFTWRVDPSIAPDETARPDGHGGTMEFAASMDEAGVTSTFVANQVVVHPRNQAELDAFLQRHGGSIVGDDAVPTPPAGSGITIDPQDQVATSYTVRVDTSTFPLDAFERDAEQLGLDNDATYSSDAGARLMALARSEQAHGVDVRPDYMSTPQFLQSTTEATLAAAPSNAFTYAEASTTGARSRVTSAWQWIAAMRNLTRIQVAVIDGGFYLDDLGNPNTTPLGTNYGPGRPIQWDFVGVDPVAAGPNSARCGGDTVCDWHGNNSVGSATGVLGDGSGAAGSGGQVADPILLKSHLDRSGVNKAIRTAVAWGADVINMSFGGPCDHDCRNYAEDFDFGPARAGGVVLVAAAGNDHVDVLGPNFVHPCIEDDVICVGALSSAADNAKSSTDTADDLTDRATYSNFGNGVDLFAPTDITVAPTPDAGTVSGSCGPSGTNPIDCFAIAGGTSAASPYVAGVVAMMRSVNYALSPQEIRARLVGANWHDSNDPSVATIGHLDALSAVRAAADGRLSNDVFEPDDVATTASVRGLGTYPDLNLSTGGDVDHLVLQSSTVSGYRVAQRYPTDLGRPNLGLVRADDSECGDIVLEASTTTPGTNTAEYRVAAGRFAVRTGNPGGTAVPYELAVSDKLQIVSSDPFETANGEVNNDVQQLATSINVGRGERQATLPAFDPADWYHFTSPGDLFEPHVGGTKFSFGITSTDIPVELQLHSASGPFGPPLRTDSGCHDLPRIDLPAGEFWAQVTPLVPGARGNYSFKASSRTVQGRLFDMDAFWAELFDPSIPVIAGIRNQVELVGLVPTPRAASADQIEVDVLPQVTTRLLDGDGHVVATEVRDPGNPNLARLVGDLRSDEAYALEFRQSNLDFLPGVTVPATIRSVEVAPPATPVQVAASSFHSCAVRADSTVVCWGADDYGSLGNGPFPAGSSNVPVAVVGLSDVKQVTTGLNHSCALRNDGTVACWGRNDFGQLGNGTFTNSEVPVTVTGLTDAVSLGDAGYYHQCAVRAGGTAVCWGAGAQGQIGDGTTTPFRSTPIAVSGLTSVAEISAGGFSTCARTTTGAASCWGDNGFGQVGDGTQTNRSLPTPVTNAGQVTDIARGEFHACAVVVDGTVRCWGNGFDGQLGNTPAVAVQTTAVPVANLTGVLAVTGGNSHTCAIKGTDGSLLCWGLGASGQLGNGSTDTSLTPVVVPGLVGSGIEAGAQHTCAVRTDQHVVCWGRGLSGQLGNGLFENRSSPVAVSGL